MSARILILMSTYNGSEYLPAQLDSLFSQTGVSLDILIRDDGSADDTTGIIFSYHKDHPNIRLIAGKNIGFAQSFFRLLRGAPDTYDYYAFCDQDDLWFDEKLKTAVNILDAAGSFDRPLLYTANVTPIDKNDMPLSGSPFFGGEQTVYEAFLRSALPGCTFVFNRSAKILLSRFHGRMYAHDWAVSAILHSFGTVIYDPDHALTGYRLHGKNTIGVQTRLSFLRTKLHNFFSKNPHVRSHFAEDFYRCYKDDLKDETLKHQIYLLAFYRKSLRLRIELAISPYFKGIFFRLYVLLKKV